MISVECHNNVQVEDESHLELLNLSKGYQRGCIAVSQLTMRVGKGEFFSLLGPSGCGKTTVLRLIAGLEKPDAGIVVIGDRMVAGENWVAPEKRRVGMVFQDYALFPHMRVDENVAFGLKGGTRRENRGKIGEVLDLVGLGGMEKRYPHELSGGQQQRVALARALAPAPEVMLLDEPFSNLDSDLRAELRGDTKKILNERGTTTILVTHDQEEAFCLSDRIGLLNHGRVEQIGTPQDIYHHPVNPFVANFVGRADFIGGWIEKGMVATELGRFSYDARGLLAEGDPVEVLIRPDDVDFAPDPSGDATVIDAQMLGPETIYRIRFRDDRIIHSLKPSTSLIATCTKVTLNVTPAHVIVFPQGDRKARR